MNKIIAAGLAAVMIIGGGIFLLMNNNGIDEEALGIAKEKKVTFEAKDGVKITADLYPAADKNAPFIILFHQASYSRGEYAEIAPKLNALGYSCLAVDQRSGAAFRGVRNETNAAALELKLPTAFEDAYTDLTAALEYVKTTYKPEELLVWGSSYSASLVFVLAAEHGEDIDGVLAFSPGEYFSIEGKSITDYAKQVKCPVFITSSKYEGVLWKDIAEGITSQETMFFVPEEYGVHGSSALLEQTPNHQEYWDAVQTFLKGN